MGDIILRVRRPGRRRGNVATQGARGDAGVHESEGMGKEDEGWGFDVEFGCGVDFGFASIGRPRMGQFQKYTGMRNTDKYR